MKKLSCLAAFLLLAAPAFAAEDDTLKADLARASQSAKASMKKACLKDFTRRVKKDTVIESAGALAPSEAITREVYRTLFWTDADRGVAFVLPVKARQPGIGPVNSNIACFYAVNDKGVSFQLSQQLMRRL